jgi:hypothetical protein
VFGDVRLESMTILARPHVTPLPPFPTRDRPRQEAQLNCQRRVLCTHFCAHSSGLLAMNGVSIGTPESDTPGQHWNWFWYVLPMPAGEMGGRESGVCDRGAPVRCAGGGGAGETGRAHGAHQLPTPCASPTRNPATPNLSALCPPRTYEGLSPRELLWHVCKHLGRQLAPTARRRRRAAAAARLRWVPSS